jgi:hypothetical protein
VHSEKLNGAFLFGLVLLPYLRKTGQREQHMESADEE